MIPNGLSDSVASLTEETPSCPVCGTEARIEGESCVSCLLRAGLEGEADASAEDFENALREINVRDTDWRLGNYQILEEIGRGGMGVIYRARQRHSKRIVALKRVLSYHGDSHETLERFRREAEAAASLDHPNILPIYEVSEAEGLPFFTMKYATGGSLQQAAPTLSAEPRECVRLLAKITRAVAYAHREGILHRDLKPGNILLDARGEPMVSDFGLAKWIDANTDLTRSLTIFGTPGYIAPEQAQGPASALSPAADVYSLGAILFDLLTGRPPFLGEHALAVIREAAEKPAPKLRTLIRHADRDLETICAKCLEREPRARYRSAADLAEDLERWLEGRPIVARPVLPPARLWRWSRRNPLLAAAAIVCVLIGAIALSRQMQSWRLEKTLTTQTAWQHSIEVIPFLDLDSAESPVEWSRALVGELERGFKSHGPAVVRASDDKDRSAGPANGSVPNSFRPMRTRLSGTLRMRDGNLRVCLRLTNAQSGEIVLQRALESERVAAARVVARTFSEEIYSILSSADLSSAPAFLSDPGLIDPETHNFITAGVDLGNRRGSADIERGIGCLRRAVELQPASSAAHAALAKVLGYKVALTGDSKWLPAAIESARRAVELDPNSSDAHLALAGALRHHGKFRAALDEALVALEFSPSSRRAASIVGNIFKVNGRPDKALAWMAVARMGEMGPLENEAGMGDCWAFLGDNARAQTAYQHYFSLHPEQPEGWMGICRLHLLNHQWEEARTLYQQESSGYTDFSYTAQMAAEVEFFSRNFAEAEKMYAELYRRDPAGGGSFYGSVSYASALGQIKMTRDRTAAIELLTNARATETTLLEAGDEDPHTSYRLAAIEASLGDKTSAVDHLQRALDAGLIDYRSLEMDPRFDLIRGEQAYQEIIEKLTARTGFLRALAETKAGPIDRRILKKQ